MHFQIQDSQVSVFHDVATSVDRVYPREKTFFLCIIMSLTYYKNINTKELRTEVPRETVYFVSQECQC